MPRDIRVGDKVRLLGWEGEVDGLPFLTRMKEWVGREAEVTRVDSDGTAFLRAAEFWWPLSKLEPLDAPRLSAWTKTSDALPQREPGDSSDHARCYVVRRKSPSNVEILMWNFHHLVWDGEDGDDFECQADEVTHWQLVPPYPDPPEVSK